MSTEITCRLLDAKPATIADEIPGDMWYCPWFTDSIQRGVDCSSVLSRQYLKYTIKYREPVVVVLPGGAHWLVDGIPKGYEHGKGWDVDGIPPKLTVTPSIETDKYHGVLVDGVLKEI